MIQKLSRNILQRYGRENENCFIFPTYSVASRCRNFIKKYSKLTPVHSLRILQLSTPRFKETTKEGYIQTNLTATFAIIFFPSSEYYLAKEYWQHSGEGISSRMADFCLEEFSREELSVTSKPISLYHKPGSKCCGYHKVIHDEKQDDHFCKNGEISKESTTFLEERFGRNLDLSLVENAERALRRRISGKINEGYDNDKSILAEDDVYLYPSGMAAIFNAHRLLLQTRDCDLKSVCFGFPYVDTRNILRKFGAGFHFFGFGDDNDLNKLINLLESGEKILALFCEFPSNPLLKCPNLPLIHELAKKFDFLVVVDETIGNFSNIHVLPYADIVVSSLTKVFSGDSNVMGGSLVLNPQGKYYNVLKTGLSNDYERLIWLEDLIYLERNSRDFAERSAKINSTADTVAEIFSKNSLIKSVYYPRLNDSSKYYEICRKKDGGYGGLLSIVFVDPEMAKIFYDTVVTAKGPSLGTNFTLTSPYAILAHYQELDYISQFGVDRNLIRISIGLENEAELCLIFNKALNIAAGLNFKDS